jgi:uncharacterized membrane protein
MQQKEQHFQQESGYYTGYHPSIDNEVPFPAQDRLPFESQVSGGPYMSSAAQAELFSGKQSSRHGSALAALCYIGLWLTGFLLLLFGVKDRFVRFHAIQSLLFFGGVNVFYIVLIYIISNTIPFIYGFAIFAFVILNIVALVAWFVGIIGALQGRYVKLPFVGDFAERYINRGSLK